MSEPEAASYDPIEDASLTVEEAAAAVGEQWQDRVRPLDDGWNMDGGSRQPPAENAARLPGAEATAAPSPAQPAAEPDYGDDDAEDDGYVPDYDEDDGVEYYSDAAAEAISLYEQGGYDPAELAQMLAQQDPEAAADFVAYWQADEQQETPLTADEYISHLQQQGQAQAIAEQLMELRARQEKWQQQAVQAVDQVDKLLGKRYTQQLQQSVADMLLYENATGTSPLDGTQTEAEMTAILRERYATAEAFEVIKQRAELKRDFDKTQWKHTGEGWRDGSHWSQRPGENLPDLDYYIQQEIEEERQSGRTLKARPSGPEFAERTRAEFESGPMHQTQKALADGWNLGKVDAGMKAQQDRIDSGRPKRR